MVRNSFSSSSLRVVDRDKKGAGNIELVQNPNVRVSNLTHSSPRTNESSQSCIFAGRVACSNDARRLGGIGANQGVGWGRVDSSNDVCTDGAGN